MNRDNISCDGIAHAILELLLFAGVPARDVLKIPGYTAYLNDIMRTAFGTDSLTAERAVLYTGYDLMIAVTVIERAHQLEVGLAAVRTGIFFHNQVAGVAFELAILFRNIIQFFIFICHFPLFRCPIHTITLHRSLINI